MSDDEEDQVESNANLFEGSLDGADTLGFGPLVPTESERSLMERVRLELKHELKQVSKTFRFLLSLVFFIGFQGLVSTITSEDIQFTKKKTIYV